MIGRTTRRGLVAAALVGSTLSALVGCQPATSAAGAVDTTSAPTVSGSSAGCQQVGTVQFDKTKFLFHASLAFGAFHHFIYKPFESGEFASGAPSRGTRLVEAGLAAVFTVHELKLAKQDAESSPTLCKIVAPLDAAETTLSNLGNKVATGDLNSGDLGSVNNSITTAGNESAQAGIPISDQVPSTSQLANPPN